MSGTDIAIRPERSADGPAIRRLLEAAFEGSVEADLVESLRADGDLVLALVAARESAIVGYVAFPRITVVTTERDECAVGLAPLAVSPVHQRHGVGSALVRAGFDALAPHETLIFVLGDPAYYRRFGFDLSIGADYASPYAGPHFMALRLSEDAPPNGTVRYPRAFSSLV